MMRCYSIFIPVVLICATIDQVQISAQSVEQSESERISFNREIRPLLSDRCFLCHGPDQSSEQAKQSDLRMDERASAMDFGVFDFSDVDESEIILRLTSDDPDVQMPPPDSSKKPLVPSDIAKIRRWIQQGAKYENHWAYEPLQQPVVPNLSESAPVKNPIDAFVLKRLESIERASSQMADRSSLIRRVTFDLTGLPPSVSEIDSFLNDSDSADVAYERVVDRLLASTHFGEHMARYWLDASRYADTSGYQYDRERQQWVWRDWVINAFNKNMPFDQFTIEQLAGDLVQNPTDQTRLATGFNRNHPITIEGGVVDEEYRTEYVIDRAVTTSTVWLGQTFLCARCHDHKYDSVSQKEFYQFYAFFNNVPERGLNGFDPKQVIVSPFAADKIESLEREVDKVRTKIANSQLPFDQWETRLRSESALDWQIQTPVSVESSGGATPKILDDSSVLMTGKNPATDDYEIVFSPVEQRVSSIQLEALIDPSLTNQSASRGSNGNFVLTEFVVESAPRSRPTEFTQVKIVSADADYEQNGYTIAMAIDGKFGQKGWAVDGNRTPVNRTAVFNLSTVVPVGSVLRIRMLQRFGRSHQIGRFRISLSENAPVSKAIQSILNTPKGRRNLSQNDRLSNRLIRNYGDTNSNRLADRQDEAQRSLDRAKKFPGTMIMKELAEPRQAYVLERGEYDRPLKSQPVEPGIPAAIGQWASEFPRNRLGLAQWLTSPNQPLTPRVTVNRFWQELFGVGLVKTSEDFGSQGEYPSHPDLLDWLAYEFVHSGWDVKGILKTIVTSNTYRQSSVMSSESFRFDPENRLLSRGPRIRLDGEAIRDNALAVSQLLDTSIGGASVYPYHPEGLWLEINNRPNFSRAYPHQTESQQHYRRSLYTFWKRTVPPPSAATFDAPNREYCVVRRSRTNTPLQAFVLMHDPQFVEAARHLAVRMMDQGGDTRQSQFEFGFKLCTSRTPNQNEMAVLNKEFNRRLKQYQSDSIAAKKLLSIGVSPVPKDSDIAKLAAFTQVARILMNLSEFLNKG